MQLLTIEITCDVLDLGLELLDTGLDCLVTGLAFDDRRSLAARNHPSCSAKVGKRSCLQLATCLLRNELATGEDGNIFKDGHAAVTEARSSQRQHVHGAPHLVNNERGKCLAFDVVRDNDHVVGHLKRLLQKRKQILYCGNLLVGDEDIGVLDDGFLAVHIRDELG